MSFNNTRRYDPPKRKRILIGETLEERTSRLAHDFLCDPLGDSKILSRNDRLAAPAWPR